MATLNLQLHFCVISEYPCKIITFLHMCQGFLMLNVDIGLGFTRWINSKCVSIIECTLLYYSPVVMKQVFAHCINRRALCRTKLMPVTHVLVDTWMLTVRPVYKL